MAEPNEIAAMLGAVVRGWHSRQTKRVRQLFTEAGVDASLGSGSRARERLRRVLAHPDIAERLVTDPRLGYKRPEQWTGYVPPLMPGGSRRQVEREALMEILRAVAERERLEGAIEAEVVG